jgi:prepilin-type N-terminal cleavage/methylation domain-containing protein
MRRLAGQERGFTLVEMLVASTLSVLVLLAAFSLVSASERASKRVRDRIDSTQRGRIALDQMTQQLRAMACRPPAGAVGYTSPIVSATDDQIVFQTNIVNPAKMDPNKLAASGQNTAAAQSAAFDADQRRLTAVRAGGVLTGIREERGYNATTGAYTQTRMLVTGIGQARPSSSATPLPVFTFFPYTSDPTAAPAPLSASAGLSATDKLRVAQVRVAFRSRPSEPSSDPQTNVDLQSSVYARTFDTQTAGSSSQPVPGSAATFERTFRCQ